MFIEQALDFKNDWWRYFIGFIVIFLFWQLIGAIPLIIGMISQMDFSDSDSLRALENPIDMFSMIGSKNTVLTLLLISFLVGFLGLFIVVKNIHNQNFKSLITSRKKIDYSRILHCFLVIFILNSLIIFISYVISPSSFEYNFQLEPFLILILICIFLLPFQTTFEELLVRGYLLQGFGIAFKSRAAAFIIPSIIFGFLHILNPEIDKLGYGFLVAYILMGMTWGIFTLMDDGNELAIGAHYANNLVVFLFLTADWHAVQTNAVFISLEEPNLLSMIIPMFIYYPILIFYFSKKYNWTNWSDKLFGKINDNYES
ncbi:MAG: CPBP family intramembrane metalloprotease [Flavobacteriaceae bacterium]|nr:CPBP family intramembrane metalloprotease [Flavobacteriaceae bacterium]MBL6683894.1 CPBP family intramembrane metalloprotease [Flavobacteriaceae bacterium]